MNNILFVIFANIVCVLHILILLEFIHVASSKLKLHFCFIMIKQDSTLLICVHSQVQNTFLVNQSEPIIINGRTTFESLTVQDSVVTEEVNVIETNETYSHSILQTLQDLWEKLEQVMCPPFEVF